MSKLSVPVTIHREINVDVSVEDFIAELNETEIAVRWNLIATIINKLCLSDQEDLYPMQKHVIRRWLQTRLEETSHWGDEQKL